MFSQIYSSVTQSQTFFWISVGIVFVVAWILRMIYEGVADMILDARAERRQRRIDEVNGYNDEDPYYEEDPEVTRIMAGIRPEEYEFDLTNEAYFEQGQRTLSDKWRNFLDEARPRSPEIVAENVYRENTYQFAPIRAEVTEARPWPQWTEEQKRQPGRHRAEEDWDLDALNTSTGSFPVIQRRELVGV